jgi:hypothetical protein
MEKKQEIDIDKVRNRGGVADIGTKEDGAIVEMININEHLITVKEKSIYDFVLADTLDPQRENPNLPSSVHEKIMDRGASDSIVARTFLTAKAVLQRSHFPASIDINKALLKMLDLAKEMAAMQSEIEEYRLAHDTACRSYEERKGLPGFMLPAVPDRLTRCKTIFQKADHTCQYLMDVIKVFYPEIEGKKGYYTMFEAFVKEKYGDNDTFTKFLHQVVPFIVEIKQARNCFDHRYPELTVTAFSLQGDGSVLPPTIEMNHAGSVINRQDLLGYLSQVMKGLENIVEVMLPYLASKHINPMGMITPQVREVPEDKRRYKMVQFGIWLPLGEGGFYSQ